jgi:hypothetical protein
VERGGLRGNITRARLEHRAKQNARRSQVSRDSRPTLE